MAPGLTSRRTARTKRTPVCSGNDFLARWRIGFQTFQRSADPSGNFEVEVLVRSGRLVSVQLLEGDAGFARKCILIQAQSNSAIVVALGFAIGGIEWECHRGLL